MKSAMQVFAVAFVAVVVTTGSTVVALHCQHCLFEGCEAGGEERIECSVHTVNRLYQHLAELANLEGRLSAPGAQGFQCFQVVISDGSKNGTIKSCAFAESDICSAWQPRISVESCQVYPDEEDHSGNYAQPSAGLPAGGSVGWLCWMFALAATALKIGSIKL